MAAPFVPTGLWALSGVPAGLWALSEVPAGLWALSGVPAGLWALSDWLSLYSPWADVNSLSCSLSSLLSLFLSLSLCLSLSLSHSQTLVRIWPWMTKISRSLCRLHHLCQLICVFSLIRFCSVNGCTFCPGWFVCSHWLESQLTVWRILEIRWLQCSERLYLWVCKGARGFQTIYI